VTVPVDESEEQTDIVVLSVALQSGRFKTELRVPLFGAPAEKEDAVKDWLTFIETAFRIGATTMEATFPKKKGPK
jgi:hypothetical protein